MPRVASKVLPLLSETLGGVTGDVKLETPMSIVMVTADPVVF